MGTRNRNAFISLNIGTIKSALQHRQYLLWNIGNNNNNNKNTHTSLLVWSRACIRFSWKHEVDKTRLIKQCFCLKPKLLSATDKSWEDESSTAPPLVSVWGCDFGECTFLPLISNMTKWECWTTKSLRWSSVFKSKGERMGILHALESIKKNTYAEGWKQDWNVKVVGARMRQTR